MCQTEILEEQSHRSHARKRMRMLHRTQIYQSTSAHLDCEAVDLQIREVEVCEAQPIVEQGTWQVHGLGCVDAGQRACGTQFAPREAACTGTRMRAIGGGAL